MKNLNFCINIVCLLILTFLLSNCGIPRLIAADQATIITNSLRIGDPRSIVLAKLEPSQRAYKQYMSEPDFRFDNVYQIDSKEYRVVYVKTRHIGDGKITNEEFTELVFENDKLFGIGNESLVKLKMKLSVQTAKERKFSKPTMAMVKQAININVFINYKDPDSAKIIHVSVGNYGWAPLNSMRTEYGYEVSCYMNLKNGFGAYTGYQLHRYIYTKSGLALPITDHFPL